MHIHGMSYRAINRLLSLELEHGRVHLSEKAIQHMRERHPNDLTQCMASLDVIITAPDFAGQSPLHPDNFVLVKHVGDVEIMVALSTTSDEYGDYPVESSYIIDHNTFRRRVRKGYYKPIK